ncbi:DUF1329 domain-containing protein [Pseudomonas fluorescens]|uniref:DUF1329 domain-containing protein n=1 Tax=Pseudomonas fluorescens TaxID=294 RepID=A0A5E7V7T4_PSEFL|nr:DUF1329 domain-containing protein [Pseudomonas fluorescens]VVQ15714.1 hypothetical protein PS928_04297 [Pseudomonas fluorescens]
MNVFKNTLMAAGAAAILVAAQTSWAAISQNDAERLGKDLTPMGAEKAGNKDGTIPVWDGGLSTPPAGFKPEQGYANPFPNEKPLFVITAQNVEQYKDKLSAGMIEMFKKYPTYRMPIYTTHRTFALPQEVYQNVKVQSTKVNLDEKGSLQNYAAPGIGFPIPKTGIEAMYNHLLRWYGGYHWCTNWLPIRPNGDFYKVGYCEDQVQASNMDNPKPNNLYYYYGYYSAPSTLIGTMYLVWEPTDYVKEDRSAWIYNSGQRRVRRAPNVAFDNTDDGTEGMRTTDDWHGFNGSMERYDWKLVGKKEMYIPYNAYKLIDPTLKYADMLDKGFIKPDLMRYELHRVWVVEAKLKDNMSHNYAKRTFYLDEDSWLIASSDAYDGRGNLWRHNTYPLTQLYDVPVMHQRPYMVHDLLSGNLFLGQIDNEIKQPSITFGAKGKVDDFQAEALRRRGM